MAAMHRGAPRSVPDPAGELYDREMAKVRAQRAAIEGVSRQRWAGSPARMEAQDAMAATPLDPEAARVMPVTGPLMEAYDDFRGGKPLQGLGQTALALGDGLLIYSGAGAALAFARGTADNVGVRTAEAVRKQLRRRGVAGRGQEIHHSVPLNGISRTAQNWRNHPAFMKVLPKADHRRMTGRWGDLPKFGPVERLWVGTPAWMKNVPVGVGTRLADGVADLKAQFDPKPAPSDRRSPNIRRP